jgi:hypothetical protein
VPLPEREDLAGSQIELEEGLSAQRVVPDFAHRAGGDSVADLLRDKALSGAQIVRIADRPSSLDFISRRSPEASLDSLTTALATSALEVSSLIPVIGLQFPGCAGFRTGTAAST